MNIFDKLATILILSILLLALQACSGDSADRPSGADQSEEQTLSEFELEHGIGPITANIEISEELNPDKINQGRNIFEMKCEMCHNMEGRMVGPPLGEITELRSPEFLMNMILNPGGMAREHPVGQELLREYMTVMPFQNVKEDEARAIVEYLRYYQKNN